MRRAERPNCAGALRVRPAVARLFYCPDKRILGTRGSNFALPVGPPIFDRGLPLVTTRSPSMTTAVNDRQTFEGVSMNVRRKWRFLVPAAVGSVVWALSAGL